MSLMPQRAQRCYPDVMRAAPHAALRAAARVRIAPHVFAMRMLRRLLRVRCHVLPFFFTRY